MIEQLRSYLHFERRTVVAILAVCIGTVTPAVVLCEPAYYVVGGAVLTLIGVPLTIWRILVVGITRSDEPPPRFLPSPGPGVLFNPEVIKYGIRQSALNAKIVSGAVATALGVMEATAPAVIQILGQAAS